MRGRALILAALLAGAGCSGPSASQEPENVVVGADAPVVSATKLNSEGNLYLSNDGHKLSVGDPASVAMDLYERPKKGKVFDIRDVPEVLGKGYKARGWESGGEGFGVILLGDQVALAVRTVSGKEESDVDDVANAYMRLNGDNTPTTRLGKTGKYWFFAEKRKRLMICGAKTRKGDWTITLALGDFEIMNQMRMSEGAAADDLRIAEQEDADR